MKIGVISDTHIPLQAKEIPAAILEAFRDVDMVLHAGDLIELDVLTQLRKSCRDTRAVWGNMDPYEVRKELQEKEIIKVGKHTIGLFHGWGSPEGLLNVVTDVFKGQDIDVFIFGHSHQPLNKKIGDALFLNPGSPTDKVFADYNSYGIIEIGDAVEARIVKL